MLFSGFSSSVGELGYVLLDDNTLIKISTYEYPILTDNKLYLYDTDGKRHIIKQNKLKLLSLGRKLFLMKATKPFGKDFEILELKAATEKYYLFQYAGETLKYAYEDELYIYDSDDNLIVTKMVVTNTEGKKKVPDNNLEAVKTIRSYFSSCTELMEKIDLSIENKHRLLGKVITINCDDKLDVNEILEQYKKKSFDK